MAAAVVLLVLTAAGAKYSQDAAGGGPS